MSSDPHTDSPTRSNQKYILIGILILAVAAGYYYFSNQDEVVAQVNGEPIYREQIVSTLEQQFASQALDTEITQMLIQQKANQEGITIAETEIDQEVARIEQSVSSQGQSLDQLLALDGIDRSILRRQIRFQKMLEQLIPPSTPPTEEEIQTEFDAQSEFYPETMSEEEIKSNIVAQMQQQSSGQSTQAYIQQLKSEANINYTGSYQPLTSPTSPTLPQ